MQQSNGNTPDRYDQDLYKGFSQLADIAGEPCLPQSGRLLTITYSQCVPVETSHNIESISRSL